MSIESAQQASADATPRNVGLDKNVDATTQQLQMSLQQHHAPTMNQMCLGGDVLLNGEMSMMGCEVDSWTTHAARPQFIQQQPQQSQQHFACPPANLTRHMSLPVSMMRQEISQPMHYGAPSTPSHAMAMPPPLMRHHSHGGYVMSPQHQQYQMTRPVNVAQMQQMFELSISNQHHQMQPMKNEAFAPMATSMNVEPMPFTSVNDGMKLGLDDGFDLEPLSYAVFGPQGTSERPKNIQQLESAIDSLDRLVEMEHELFQPAEFNGLAPRNQSNLITPRNGVYGRAALPLLLSPQHAKEMATSPASASAMALAGMMISNHTPKSAKNMATCKIGGCDRRVRSKGFCKTHGGGRKCSIEGCKKSSQNGDFCIGHGGGKKCKEEGCAKAAQSHGLCKAHGGGARCKFLDCNKSSQGGGLCRAHGGGKRCQASGCPKGAQRGNFCATHGGFRNCKIDGCVRTDRGGGFCEVHRRGRLCKIDGCKKLSRNQGMCTMHIREDKQEDGGDAHGDDALPTDVYDATSSLIAA
ncbi:hypothetical protein FI667_g14121, partial [Globisporangium splendens]